MATEISASANGVSSRVAAAIERVLRAESQALQTWESLSDAVNQGAISVNNGVDKFPSDMEVETKVDEVSAKIDAVSDNDLKQKLKAIFDPVADEFSTLGLDGKKSFVKQSADDVQAMAQAKLAQISEVSTAVSDTVENTLRDVDRVSNSLHQAAADIADLGAADIAELTATLKGFLDDQLEALREIIAQGFHTWKSYIEAVEDAIDRTEAWIVANTQRVDLAADRATAAIDQWAGAFDHQLSQAQTALNKTLWAEFEAQVIGPVVDRLYDTTQWPQNLEAIKETAIDVTETLSDEIEEAIDDFAELPLSKIQAAKDACLALVGVKTQILGGIVKVAEAADAQLKTVLAPVLADIDALKDNLGDWEEKIKEIEAGGKRLLDTANEIGNQIAEAGDNARAYMDRGAEILARIGDAKATQLPGLVLHLVSAATDAPEIAAFRANRDRIRVLLDEAKDVLETPAVRGLLDQLGDGLKALGLDFSFKEFGDQFLPDINADNLLSNLIPDCGINIKDMLSGARIPGSLSNAIKVTHDLDTKVGRAWIQADVNVPLPGRETMFTIGPFTLFLRDTLLNAFMRAEASRDQDEVQLSDLALLRTNLEAVVAGQVMVTLQDVVIRYSSRDQLQFELDPKKIRIHPNMQFIQDTLGSIFGDDIGGLQFIKEGGIPVGVEHKFAIPPISLMYGTSGVSNLQISNRFSLRAYPDFIITNRFNLSRRELPFIFSVFIIGGTGYIQVDADYRPFDKRLVVGVEAGVGGSAALGFAFGPVAGSVFISISVVIRYQKTIGDGPKGEDGLSVSLVLVIAGTVSLWGMATIYLGLMLSIRYHESGQMDGLGQLTVELRISRFFKLKFSTQVKYKLRDGRATTQVTSQTTTDGTYKDTLKKYKALDKVRSSL